METTFLHHQVKKAVLRVCEDLSSPVSLKVSSLIRNGEWDQLAQSRVNPRHYIDADSYWRDATAVSILRKLTELPTSFNRKAAAEKSFIDCEASCLRANRRLYPYLNPNLWDVEKGVTEYFSRARKIARDILGPVPYLIEGKFGPGATYGDRGRLTTIADKMSSNPTITPGAKYSILPWMHTAWARACATHGNTASFVQGNRFTTVPKDCEKDRGIAIEPSINVFYQLGHGRVIRNRLKFAGIDLANGQDIHRRVACEASIRGHLATLDLSNASDTVSRNLVKLLLPPQWFESLDDLRSKKTEFRGRWHVLEKFSSMGNGFTFELETLIFLCLILAVPSAGKLVPGENVFVFGDDIIIPTEISKDVISALSFCGLTVNKEKSFVDGPFRESCGGDYFMGSDVRPYFMKDSPSEPQQLIALANALRHLGKGSKKRFDCVIGGWFCVLDALPNNLRGLRGPSDLGDLLIHDEESRWRPRWRSGIRYFKVYRPARYRKVPWSVFRPEVVLAAATYGAPWGGGGIIPRKALASYKVGWVARS